MASPLADRLRPQTLDDVVGQQHLPPVRAHHPGGGRQMPVRVVPAVELLAAPQPAEHLRPIPGLLLVPGPVSFQFLCQCQFVALPHRNGTILPRRRGKGKGRLHALCARRCGTGAQKLSNDSCHIFTVSCCKRCPFMLIYRKRDLKLHESVANRSAPPQGPPQAL